jgi:uncharacterized protein YecT (DUF1311 family)
MNRYIAPVVLALAFPGLALAFEANDQIDMAACNSAQCVEDQILACAEVGDAGDGYRSWRICAMVAFEQSDLLLNEFYEHILEVTKDVEQSLSESAYTGQEVLLRRSQRAWLEVRDSTCELNVLYGAIMSGYDSVVDQCKARLTMQRIGDLQNEIGHYPNSRMVE